MVSAVDTAEQIINKWSDDESSVVDIVILPLDSLILLLTH